MKLMLPEWISEELYMAYLEDWGEEKIVPFVSRLNGMTYGEWLANTIKSRTVVPAHLVPSTLLCPL